MKSILFSLYQHFRTLSFWVAIGDVALAVRGMIRAIFNRSKDARILASARMSFGCEKCEFFDETWQTCGTPGETMGDRQNPSKIGCWCYLPLANRDPKKDCWARFHDIRANDGSPIGWSDALRPNASNR